MRISSQVVVSVNIEWIFVCFGLEIAMSLAAWTTKARSVPLSSCPRGELAPRTTAAWRLLVWVLSP